MRRNTRLTERDLNRIVRRVINEGVITGTPSEPYIETDQDFSAYEGKTGSFKFDGGSIDLMGTDGKLLVRIGGRGLPAPQPATPRTQQTQGGVVNPNPSTGTKFH
jgi:hypothetical protein